MRFFFYGTLIDPDVRRAVLGAADAGGICLRDGVLRGWERRAVAGESFPVILEAAGGRVGGVLASGLGAAACRRLLAYEGADYVLRGVEVDCVDGRRRPAQVFVPHAGGALTPAAEAWSYETWRARDKRDFLRRLAEFG